MRRGDLFSTRGESVMAGNEYVIVNKADFEKIGNAVRDE